MFKENLFYKNSILKTLFVSLELVQGAWLLLASNSQVQLPWLLEFSPTPPEYIEGELLCWQPLVFAFKLPSQGCARYVQLGSYLVTDLATRVSVCHFLDAKLVSFLLNDRRHHLPWKDGGYCWHEHWQRLVKDPPWVFWCIWQNLCNLHIPQVQAFHHAKLHPKPLQKSHHV